MLSGGSSTNEDLYNGKTLTGAFGLGWYHYGARFYDGATARWTTMDPADEFNSPYVYVGGDPVNLVDPDGRQSVEIMQDIENRGAEVEAAPLEKLEPQEPAIRAWEPTFWDRWAESEGLVGRISYALSNSPYVAFQTLNPFDDQVVNLDGSLTTHRERMDAGVESAPIGLAIGKVINFARFGREIVFNRNFRIAPFGNRTGHPTGRYPHYHRRGLKIQIYNGQRLLLGQVSTLPSQRLEA